MIKTLTIDDFLASHAAHGGTFVDVRTSDEFEKGHIEGAVNLPLFTPSERAEVGTLYVRTDRQAAIERGLEAVGPKLADFVRQAKTIDGELYIYCARGGMRSASMAWLLDMAGFKVRLLKGGYKAYRAHLDHILEAYNWKFVVISGATGSGKSELLDIIATTGEQVIDLEGLAHHKGSAFGHLGQLPQPSTEQFINIIHENLRKLDPSKIVWCEGESMLIGHLFLPQKFFAMMQSAKRIEVVMDVEQRLDRLTAEYGSFDIEALISAFEKITKRLGYDNAKNAVEALRNGDIRGAAAIALIYYDKAYARSAVTEGTIKWSLDNNELQANAKRLIKIVKKQL